MKVKVSYTVNMEEVPEEIILILSKAEAKLGNVTRTLANLTTAESPILKKRTQEAVLTLESLRKELFDADILLGDSESILRGYLKEIASPSQPQVSGGQEDETKN